MREGGVFAFKLVLNHPPVILFLINYCRDRFLGRSTATILFVRILMSPSRRPRQLLKKIVSRWTTPYQHIIPNTTLVATMLIKEFFYEANLRSICVYVECGSLLLLRLLLDLLWRHLSTEAKIRTLHFRVSVRRLTKIIVYWRNQYKTIRQRTSLHNHLCRN